MYYHILAGAKQHPGLWSQDDCCMPGVRLYTGDTWGWFWQWILSIHQQHCRGDSKCNIHLGMCVIIEMLCSSHTYSDKSACIIFTFTAKWCNWWIILFMHFEWSEGILHPSEHLQWHESCGGQVDKCQHTLWWSLHFGTWSFWDGGRT